MNIVRARKYSDCPLVLWWWRQMPLRWISDWKFRLTKLFQVVHRVHVVHSLAIEVEPAERNFSKRILKILLFFPAFLTDRNFRFSNTLQDHDQDHDNNQKENWNCFVKAILHSCYTFLKAPLTILVHIISLPGIFDNCCFWEACCPTGVYVKHLLTSLRQWLWRWQWWWWW